MIMPALPESWETVLGEAQWRLEWVNQDGTTVRTEINGQSYQNAGLMQGWQSAIIAYPFWSEKNIPAGLMKPAGALFPFDADNGKIRLSWQGGIDANFYRELAARANEKRLPYNFDWKRFRELFYGDTLKDDVRADPWLADWALIAEKTASGGFDKRRIAASKRVNCKITVPADGPWISDSPFMSHPPWTAGDNVTVPVSDGVTSFFCREGVLHCSKNVWTWNPYNNSY
ncbi:hypothetical protein AGMMS50212_07590 [Spirochaetia bacterium]|nr:hypothetical protein AGMMS50212_07590 [Spirochaetia bacterium]